MSRSLALVPTVFSPVDCVVRHMNANALAWVAEDATNRAVGLLVEDAYHWVMMGIFQGADFDAMMDAEFEKERRKASYYDDFDMESCDCWDCSGRRVVEGDNMQGEDWYI